VPGSNREGRWPWAFAVNAVGVFVCSSQLTALALSSAFNVPTLTLSDVEWESLSKFLGKSWGSFGYDFQDFY
jgi:hypothetical protein